MHLHLSILSNLSHFDHLCMYKTSQQQLQPGCLAMKAISQMFCSLKEEMGHHSISNQCFHRISASLLLQNLNFVSFTLFFFKFSIDLTMSVTMYPTTLFKKCVSRCGFQEWYPLHTFVESFQGQYKDGSNGTCDFRDLIFDWDIKHFTHTILISTLKLHVPHMVLILYVCYL